MTDVIRAPWTPVQVAALNEFQRRGGMHPFTCGNERHEMHVDLVAHADGWRCPNTECDYQQDWAHAFMADPDAWPKSPFGERHGSTPEEVHDLTAALRERRITQPEPCRTTRHCAYHGWCRRCAPDFAATMSLINVAIQRTDPDETHWGPLYEAIGKALKNGEQPPRTIPDNSPTSSDTTDNPATVTDPAYLRQQYAEAIRAAACTGECGMTEADCTRHRIQPEVWHHGVLAEVSGTPEMLADAVLNVRDRHVLQLRQRLDLAAAELANWAASDSADAAADSYAHRAETAEQQRDRLAGLLREVLDQTPASSVSKAGLERWRAVLDENREQPNA